MKPFIKILIVGLIAMITYSFYGENIELLGLYPTRPNNFFRYTLGVSMTAGWVIYYLVMVLFSWLYYKFQYIFKINSIPLRGLIFGTIFFIIFTEFLIAAFNSFGGLPKEPNLLAKSLSYYIAHLFAGLVTAYGFKLLENVSVLNDKNNE